MWHATGLTRGHL